MWDTFQYTQQYHADFIYNSFEGTEKFSKESNLCIATGFATWCPPGYCNWFIRSLEDNKDQIVDNKAKLIKFLGNIDNPHKAYILITASQFGDSGGYPINAAKIKYKKMEGKFYFIERLRLSDCPVQYFDCLISVDKNGRVVLEDKRKTGNDEGCI